jgi:phospholipid/cholesterol/gamma-HCH transport system permease protein
LTLPSPSRAIARFERAVPGTLAVSVSGAWRVVDDRAAANDLLAGLAGETGVDCVALRDEGIDAWDSALLVFLRAVAAVAKGAGARIDDSGLPEGVRRLLHLSDAVPERKGARRGHDRVSWLTRVGARTQKGLHDAGESIKFLGELTLAFGAMVRGRARYRRSDFLAIIQECGPEALPIVSLISLLVGMILAFLGSVQLKMFGAEIFVADAVALGMVREMGALMTGIIMAGRTGAAFAARLGTMQVNEEVDALQTLGFSPMEFLVLPRAVALILMMPLLSIYANVLGILGGAIVGIALLDLTPTQYYLQTLGAIDLQGVVSGLIKSCVFGVLVAVSGCMQGIRCGRSASAVGEATTTAVVNAIVYIVVADSLISILYVITGF